MFQQIANFPSPPILTSLSPTVANCSDTTTETAVITVVVPPNTWDNGKSIAVQGYFEKLQSSGGSLSLTLKAKLNASSVTLANAITIYDNGNTGKSFLGLTFRRTGANVVLFPSSASAFMPTTNVLTTNSGFSTNNFSTNIYTSMDFTATITITLTAQWSGAPGDGSVFFNCIFADAFKY